MRGILTFAIGLLLGVLMVTAAQAEVSVSCLFSDHMVLQRERAVPVWGEAAPGERVTVSFDGKQVSATAEAAGKWKVMLPAHAAGGPFTLTVAGKNTVAINDVLVGEVWMASGQSNMQFGVRYANNAKEAIAGATDGTLRFFSTPRVMALEPQTTVKSKWVVCSPEEAGEFSAVAYFFARELQARLRVPVGILQTAYSGSKIEPYIDMETLKREKLAPEIDWWERACKDPKLLMAEGCPSVPTSTYNSMINPLVPYGMRGVLWYQGEENVGLAPHYRVLLPTLISGWRRLWNAGDFPFLIVQLAGFGAVPGGEGPGESEWAELREAQASGLSVSNTGLATAIDLGDPNNIHPTNKLEVGRRLALVAGHLTYGWKDEYSGPVFRSLRVRDRRAVVSFDHTTGGLVAKGDLRTGFALAGEDRKFYWAEGTIEGNTVVLSSPKVPHPVAVRYAWGDTPACSLYNGAGLPAPPFRTDTWPGVTAPR